MAKQAARRKPRAKPDAAWPETALHSADDATAPVRPRAATGALSNIAAVRPAKRSGRSAAAEKERNAAVAMGEALTSGFQQAVEAAVREAHAEGLAVPAQVDGVAVEIRPDGEIVPIDDRAPWSPEHWRRAAAR